MTDRDAFIRAILADPADDTQRLVYADWLEEFGDDADRARAAFIRVQCRIARIACPDYPNMTEHPDDLPELDALHVRDRELFDAIGPTLRAQEAPWVTAAFTWASLPKYPHPSHVVYHRGFVEVVTCSGDDWCRHAGDVNVSGILGAHPVTGVNLTAWPDLSHTVRRYGNQREPWFEFDVAGKLIVVKMSEVPPGDDITLLVLRKRWPRVTFRRFMASGTEGTVTVGGQAIPVSSWTLAPAADPS